MPFSKDLKKKNFQQGKFSRGEKSWRRRDGKNLAGGGDIFVEEPSPNPHVIFGQKVLSQPFMCSPVPLLYM